MFVDTILICSIAALSIIITGTWQTGETGAALTAMAFNQAIPYFGTYIVSFALILFVILRCSAGNIMAKMPRVFSCPKVRMVYRIIFIPFLIIGAVGGLKLFGIWLIP